MKEIKRETPIARGLAGNDQDGTVARLGKRHKRPDQFVEGIARDIVFVEKITAVDKEINLGSQSVFDHAYKIFKNRLGPLSASVGVGYGCPGDMKAKVCICRVNELQEILRRTKGAQ